MRFDVCPWWLGYLLASPLRRLIQDPAAIVAPYVSPGMIVLEPGPGMGFFTLELARRVGGGGVVVAVDIQPRMLRALERRLERAHLRDRAELRQATPHSLAIDDFRGRVDFTLAFWMVHELPDAAAFFAQTRAALHQHGTLLLSEPRRHVSAAAMAKTVELARKSGFAEVDRPQIRWSESVLLKAA